MLDLATLRQLARIVGRQHCRTDPEDLLCYGYDASKLAYTPEAVVFPGSTEEIAAILRLATEQRLPVVPRGAGSGVAGGTLPVRGGLILSLSRLNRILEIDAANLVAVVEPGVVTSVLQDEVAQVGLFYPPDPASLAFSTIGGNIATCAGGSRALKYGVTRDYVLGLEAVLASGQVLRTGVQTRKGVVGYDLTRLLVGSEGTLAVITKAILKLIPQPESRATMLAVFQELGQAAAAVTGIVQAHILPSALEFMDQETIRCVDAYLDADLPVAAGALLIIEVDGDREGVSRQARAIEEICRHHGAGQVEIASTAAAAVKIWEARRAIGPALFQLNPDQIAEDIAVPRSTIPKMVAILQDIRRRYHLHLVCFGHAGDGNIHVCIMIDRNNPAEVERTERAVEEIFRETLRLGGTISGEHGIGLTKTPYLALEIDPVARETMRRLKVAFDPLDILNPGKILISDEDKEKIRRQLWPRD